MKILVFVPYFYPKIGGIEEHTFNLHKRLVEKGFEITIVTTKHDPSLKSIEIIQGIKVIRLEYQFKISNTPVSFKWARQIKEIIYQEKPRLIMTHTPVPFLSDIVALVNKNIPIIMKYHSGSMIKENVPISNILIFLYEKIVLKLVISKIDYLICTSDFVRNGLLKEYKYKSTTITPGVDINQFYPKKTLDKLHPSILFVGRIDKTSKWKGLKYLIDAFALIKNNLPTTRLLIVGGGDGLIDQMNYVKHVGIQNRVDFLGSLKGLELAKIFQESSLLVLPSTSEAESFGMVLIEAMACKKPVIGSKIGGVQYVINDNIDGILVPPKNAKALSKAIFKLIKYPKLANKMGENGYKKIIENYTWDVKVNETINVISKIIRK